MKTPREVVQDWVAAYNQRVACAVAELYHEDATNLQVALGNPTIGRQAMLDDLLSFFHAFPDNFTHPENLLEDGEWAMLEWFGGGTWRGEFGGMAPNGTSYTLEGGAGSGAPGLGGRPHPGASRNAARGVEGDGPPLPYSQRAAEGDTASGRDAPLDRGGPPRRLRPWPGCQPIHYKHFAE